MDGNRGASEHSGAGGAPDTSHGEDPAAAESAERLGPLAVRRLRKDDGRALLVFSRADEPAP